MKNKISKLAVITALSATMIGCGGGGSSSEDPKGRFADSVVVGLGYATTPSGRSDVTGASGEYDFTGGDTVTFSVAGIELGSAKATEATLFPRDISGGNSDKAAQIAHLLQNLDADRDPSNGINLSNVNSTITVTADKEAIELVLDSPLTNFKDSDFNLLGTTTGTSISRASATAHVQDTLKCGYSGGYRGTYQHDDGTGGRIGLLINTDGSAVAVSGYDLDTESESGIIPIISSFASADLGAVNFGADTFTFSATADSLSAITITADNTTLTATLTDTNNLRGDIAFAKTATFTASRIGGAIDAKHRFTGAYYGDDSGLFTFDIDADNDITGLAYSVPDDELFTLTGSLTDSIIRVTSSGGATATANVDLASGALSSGAWNNTGEKTSGEFRGSGCHLNPQPIPEPTSASTGGSGSSAGLAPADQAAFARIYSEIILNSGVNFLTRQISGAMLSRASGDKTTYKYMKTGQNTATITETTMENFGFGDLTLTFTSSEGGTYVEGSDTSSPSSFTLVRN